MKSRLFARAGCVLALLVLGCGDSEDPQPNPPVVDPCEGLPPLTLKADPQTLRVAGVVNLTATGGSGHYRFRSEQGGSSGEIRGDRFVAGLTPSTDTLIVEDLQCSGSARTTVQVVAAFDVAPSRAMVRPGTSFQVLIQGLLGSAEYSLPSGPTGSTVSATGVYTAGANPGTDLVRVRDLKSGDVAVLEFQVSASAKLKGDPGVMALPSGSSIPIATTGGSDRVTWSMVSGPGKIEGGFFKTQSGDKGLTVLEASDPFTLDKARVSIRVLDELARSSQAHGRTTDLATITTADFDGDGFQDVAVGQRESDINRPQGGAVFVFKGSSSGLSSQPAWVLSGQTDTAGFGDTVVAGDLDNDGRAELVVGSPGADITGADSGAVYIYKWGSNGPELMRAPLTSIIRGGAFSTGVAVADADGDGDLDLIVGAPLGDLATAASRRGTIDIFTLTPGQPIPDLPAIRLGGSDLSSTGTPMSRNNTDLGRAIVAADFNGDGRVDVAALSKVSRYNADGTVASATSLVAVSVFFGRAEGTRFRETADAYVMLTNTADANEGTWRLGVVPSEAGRPAMLMAVADRADSPNLTSSGGNAAATDAGGAFIFNLSAMQPTGTPAATPTQVTRETAFARIYGEAASIFAGRSFAVADVDGQPGSELVLGAPYASAPAAGNTTLRNSGRVLAYPLASLTQGASINKPLAVIHGQNKSDVLGVGLAPWSGPGGGGLVAFAGRASTDAGAFTGRLESFSRAGASFAEWTRTALTVPAKPSVERFGEVVAAATGVGGRAVAIVGAPGYSGPGTNGDGADLTVGRAFTFDATQGTPAAMVAEGASAPVVKGKAVGVDVTFTDFNGDGRPDAVVGATGFTVPSSTQTADLAVYSAQKTGCVTTSAQGIGGLLVSLQQADGTFKDAYRLWAPTVITGCTPETDARCKRSAIGRGVVGGFDFNGDGKKDIGALRNNGFEVFLGRAPDDASLAKLTMGCDPLYFTDGSTTRQTSVPTALGDLNGDGCDEVGWRYTESNRAGVIILFGYDTAGAKCGGKTTASWVRLAADGEVGGNFLGLGVSMVRAGKFLNDGKDLLAISATSVPYDDVTQPAVLLFETAQLVAKRPASGEALVGAVGGGLTPVTLVHRTRAVNFGRALEGGRDLTGDSIPDLIVSATGASEASDGGGAVYIYAGGTQSKGKLTPWLTVAGDVTERSNFGQDLALTPGGSASPPTLIIGAPTSYRTGTQNGTAFSLPLGF
ncbi:FG-GAP-like repeat-containing protein [Hyalangium versicolor]|uniref:FG-GAP-like repeat-containing protein n=1 Tax=Hyalangium versicolor TaxID=2861190 RepID=UPI001CCA9E55|nr:FG-GAP-like repeat-containing protein [Hyalangium versicolor]